MVACTWVLIKCWNLHGQMKDYVVRRPGSFASGKRGTGNPQDLGPGNSDPTSPPSRGLLLSSTSHKQWTQLSFYVSAISPALPCQPGKTSLLLPVSATNPQSLFCFKDFTTLDRETSCVCVGGGHQNNNSGEASKGQESRASVALGIN